MKFRIFAMLMATLLCFTVVSCSVANTKEGVEEGAGTMPVLNTTTASIPAESITIADPASTQPTDVTGDPVAEPSIIDISPSPEPEDSDFVCIWDYIPTIYVDLKYATTDNFTEQVIYDFTDAYLRYGTVKKLIVIQDNLVEQGFSLKIWDAFRPIEAQFKLWEVCPDSQYVANPNKGYSSHSKGNTLDVTLVYLDGTEVGMPTGFDDFSKLADRDYSDIDPVCAENAFVLETVMLNNGFTAYAGEWWHYSDTTAYPVEESFVP